MATSTPAIIAKTPVPERLPFVKGEEVVYQNLSDGSRWATTVRRAVNVQGATRRIRYYSLEGAPGVLIPADRLLHSWEA